MLQINLWVRESEATSIKVYRNFNQLSKQLHLSRAPLLQFKVQNFLQLEVTASKAALPLPHTLLHTANQLAERRLIHLCQTYRKVHFSFLEHFFPPPKAIRAPPVVSSHTLNIYTETLKLFYFYSRSPGLHRTRRPGSLVLIHSVVFPACENFRNILMNFLISAGLKPVNVSWQQDEL